MFRQIPDKKEKTISEEKVKQCDHDECHECHHLIAKGTGQKVTEVYMTCFDGGILSWSVHRYEAEREVIFCDLHKKPYDKFENADVANNNNREAIYTKRVEPWKRVNPDGTDYKEKTK